MFQVLFLDLTMEIKSAARRLLQLRAWILSLIGFFLAGIIQPTLNSESLEEIKARAHELSTLRWGLFVCWSFSTFSDREWTPGIEVVSFFNPSGLDTDQWARTAKAAQMGYILFLTKHHDGFCLWDTKTSSRKVTQSPLRRDVLKELRNSCDQYGIKLALYFSEGDWTFPGAVDGKGGNGGGKNPAIKTAQLRELLTNYGPIEFIWFDHAVGDGGVNHLQTAKLVKSLQPGCFVGFNHGGAAGDLRLGEMGYPSPLNDPSGAGYGSQDAGAYQGYYAAEFTLPILGPVHGKDRWFYTDPANDNQALPADKVLELYNRAVRCGNIFSLDVGPDRTGHLRSIDVRTLQDVGRKIKRVPSPQ